LRATNIYRKFCTPALTYISKTHFGLIWFPQFFSSEICLFRSKSLFLNHILEKFLRNARHFQLPVLFMNAASEIEALCFLCTDLSITYTTFRPEPDLLFDWYKIKLAGSHFERC